MYNITITETLVLEIDCAGLKSLYLNDERDRYEGVAGKRAKG